MNKRMKVIKLMAIFCLLLTYQASAQSQFQKDSSAIQAVLFQQQDAWNNADLDGFMAHYWKSENLQFVSKNGVKYGWQKVYDGYKKNYQDKGEMGKLTFGIISLSAINEQNYMLTGSWKVENKSGSPSGYFSLWFKKIGGKWLIVSDHTS